MKNCMKSVVGIRQWFGGVMKSFVAIAALAFAGAAWGATQKIGTQTWTYDLVIEGGSTIVAKVASVALLPHQEIEPEEEGELSAETAEPAPEGEA